ncbi:uncharacterized protein LOC129229611 [Uloborus diversus]|uniref:uncharacterized protein LOC129229611 n=1 Tax=Uloborus diversus TaxID=327109 RepID=UPI002409124A|nr:uncharacterized protein LOC129229611 [Uloborus diversus]
MRIALDAIRKCWILLKAQKAKEVSDIETDEGPVKKHRRLTADHWRGTPSRMDKYRRDRGSQNAGDVIRKGLTTRDVGILCSDLVPMNDKCIMVGTTGIAALKAEYGDDFTNFEIIQDVGYSSESSTHLSGDDIGTVGGDHYYNIRVYNCNTSAHQGISLREELENAKKFHDRPLASSLESSSLDDSGLGVSEAAKNWSNPEDHGKTAQGKDPGSCPEASSSPEDESDFLETVFGGAMNFGSGEKVVDNSDGAEIFQFELSSVESDDPSTTFQNRSSFASSAQVFYKMISVDSDNGEPDSRIPDVDENRNDTSEGKTPPLESASNLPSRSKSNVLSSEKNNDCSDSDLETFKTVPEPKSSSDWEKSNPTRCKKALTSTPITGQDDKLSNRSINLKRKRDSDSSDVWQTPNRNSTRVRSWLKRCSDTSVRRSLFGRRTPDDVTCRQRTSAFRQCLNTSSCDASAECTSSSADEGNAFSSSSSYFDDEFSQQKSRLDSTCGSIETVLEQRRRADTERSSTCCGRADTECNLLPSPPFATPLRRLSYKNTKLKALSDGEIRKCQTFCDQEKTEPGTKTPHSKSQDHPSISSSSLKPRHCSSLPCILRTHHSESSTDDCARTSALFLTPHSYVKTSDDIFEDDVLNTSGVASNVSNRNHSGSSDVGRRRRRRSRKKSTSSNRSSLSVLHSGDSGRHRYNKTTESCGSRRRHFSQRSDFFGDEKQQLEIEIPPLEDNLLSEKDLESDSFHSDLSLEKKFVCRDSSALPSPVESDVILTHLEEQSTVSDQVWDGYQDMPYLSEAYSESTIDEDAVRKLIEFGDDYTSAIGNPARHLETADGNNNRPEASRSPNKKSSKVLTFPKTQRLSSLNQDSDSDSEELHYLLKDTSETLEIVRATLSSGTYLTSAECAHLLATCRTHLNCLRDICDQIETDGKEGQFSGDDLKNLHYLIEEWEALEKSAEMSEELIHQKYIKAKENIDALFTKMSEISSHTKVDTGSFKSWQQIKENVSKLQSVLSTLQETHERLVEVNVQVHHFTAEYGSYKDNTLKDDIVELYRQWDDVYEQNNEKLTHLQTLCNRWDAYDGKFRSLHSKIKAAEMASGSNTRHSMEESHEKSGLSKDLKELRDEVVFFESCLNGGMVWKTIDKDLQDLEKRVEKSVKASKSAYHPLSSTTVEDDPDDRFEDAIQLQEDDEDESDVTDCVTHAKIEKKAGDRTGAKSRGSSRFWRVFRVAVPVQLALVLLYCLACYLEPNCCDMVNNFNFSFTPQLRYFRGPPPV